MDKNTLAHLIGDAIRSITGDERVTQDYGKSVFDVLNGQSDEIIHKTIKRVISKYQGSTKYPPRSFWIGEMMYEKKQWETFNVKKNYREEQSEEEKIKVASMAHDLAEQFKTESFKDKVKTNYDLKVDRYKENAKAGNVLLRGGVLDGQWVKREEAERDNHEYRCPIEWLSSQEKRKNINNMGIR